MRTHELGSTAPSTARAGVGFAGLTLLTHAANFGFVVVAGRLLDPGPFSDLVALLGIVLLGLAPGMAVQALAAAGALGGPALVDRELGRRLGNGVAVVVLAATAAAATVLQVDDWLVLATIPLAATLLTRTAMNEGLLQGRHRFVALGTVMATGAWTKLLVGVVLMVLSGDVGTVTLAIALGYLVQLLRSQHATADEAPERDPRGSAADVTYAVAVMGFLLLVVHVDGVLAPALLPGLEAGRYGVGVTVARITFWLPQFAVLLWFPRMVRSRDVRLLLGGLGFVAALALLGTGAALLLGPQLATLVFGTELGQVGPELWQFVLIGGAALSLQVVTLADLARRGRSAWFVLVPAPVMVAVALAMTEPTSAGAAASAVAAVLCTFAVIGAVSSVAALRRTEH